MESEFENRIIELVDIDSLSIEELVSYGLHGVRGTEWWPLNPWLG